MSKENPEADQINDQNTEAKATESKLVVEIPATIHTLEKVKYQDLLETFTVLGVEDAWKPGSDKVKMITDALAKIAILRDLEQKGLAGEELAKKADVIQAQNKALVELAQENEDEAVVDAAIENQMSVKEGIDKMKLTKEQLESNLANMNANLSGCGEAQRAIILVKRQAIQELLKEESYNKYDKVESKE